MKKYESPSAKLFYKVLNLPPNFSIKGEQSEVNDHRMAYVFSSIHKDRTKAMALFGFPVANADHPRSVNIIREADHHLWTSDFVSLTAGKFPSPQHALSLYARAGNEETPTHCLLIGDAAHAFPPDLGLGVNSALEDLYELEAYLINNVEISDAFRQYEEQTGFSVGTKPRIEILSNLAAKAWYRSRLLLLPDTPATRFVLTTQIATIKVDGLSFPEKRLTF